MHIPISYVTSIVMYIINTLDTLQREMKWKKIKWRRKTLFAKRSCVSIVWIKTDYVSRGRFERIRPMRQCSTLDCPSLVVQLRVETLADITSNLDEPRSSRTSVDEKETSASFLSIVIKNNRIINVQFERLLNRGLLL